VQQKLEDKMVNRPNSGSINVIGVDELEGEKIGLGVLGPIASRTDTRGDSRSTRDASAMTNTRYRCEKTNFDTHINYAKLDAWAKFPDFQTRVATAILKRQALDRIRIGFNGVKVAADTNPLLQDVNKGWLQQIRENSPQRVMAGRPDLPGKVIIGRAPGADYANLDAAVYDAVTNLDPWYQDDTAWW
jgi:P2 family phage major capsid protein